MAVIREKYGIDSFTLKMIAIISMLIDHVGAILFPQIVILRIIGRLAFPIFAYTLTEGFFYTHDLKKYMLRMGLLALVSEIPFDLANTGKILEFGHQNVFFTLFLGLVMLRLFTKLTGKVEQCLMVIGLFLLAEFLRTDYSSMGLLMIFMFYIFRERAGVKIAIISVINILLMGYIQAFGALAMIPISLHNGKQGRKMKYFFYLFYPVHLLILYIVSMVV